MYKKLKVVSLFSGSGGMDLGFLNTKKYDIIFANDVNKYAYETYKQNIGNHIICEDISKLVDIPKADVVIGGPPCQGFSLANPSRAIDDPRNLLFKEYIRILEIVNPLAFVFENVTGILTLGGGEAYKIIVNSFENIGYDVYDKVLNAVDYGVPQYRKRNFIVGIKRKLKLSYRFPTPTTTSDKYLTVKAIKNPPLLKNVSNHEFSKLTPLNTERLQHIPPGGAMKDIPKHLQNNSDVKRAMRRLSFDEPSPTIVHNNCDHYYHPSEPRRITIREMARIQTYPDDFVFCGHKNAQSTQVGNSVPVKLAESVAESVFTSLQGMVK